MNGAEKCIPPPQRQWKFVEALKKPFGVFLLVSGLYTVFSKPPKSK